jgi:hypothetical protein
MTWADELRITEADIADLCGPAAFERARRYYRNGHVRNPRIKDNTLLADVLGSASEPYQVEIGLFDDELAGMCDCPVVDDFCKHIGAVLFAWVYSPHRFAGYSASVLPSDHSPVAGPRSAVPDQDVTSIDQWLPSETDPEDQWLELLDGRTVAELRQIARRRGISLRGNAKYDLIAQVASGLVAPDGVRQAIASLTPEERVVLDLVRILDEGGPVKAIVLYGTLASLDVTLPTDPAAVLLDLRDRGLIAAGPHGAYDEDAYCMPAHIRQYLPPADYLVHRVDAPLLREDVPPARAALDELLYLLCRHFQDHALTRRPAPDGLLLEKSSDRLRGWRNVPGEIAQIQFRRNWEWLEEIALTALPPEPDLSQGDLAALAPLASGDRELIDFACHLLRSLRMLSGKDHFVAHEDVLRHYLRYSPQRRRAIVARAWLELTSWHELNLVLHHDPRLRLRRFVGRHSSIKPKDIAERIARGRALLVRLLSALEEGVWYSFSALADTMRRLGAHYFADPGVGPSEQPQWWIELDLGAKLDPANPDDWDRGYAPILEAVLRGPLTWLGVASLAQAESGLAFRIDGLAALLAGSNTESSPAKSILSVSDELVVTVPAGYPDLAVHDYLSQVAAPITATPVGTSYLFTATRSRDAFALGYDAPSTLTFLERAGASLPASFCDNLLQWHHRYGDLHLYTNLTLIEFADDFVLPELLASTSLPKYLIYRFSPRLIAIDPDSSSSFTSELVRKGHTPKLIAGPE